MGERHKKMRQRGMKAKKKERKPRRNVAEVDIKFKNRLWMKEYNRRETRTTSSDCFLYVNHYK